MADALFLAANRALYRAARPLIFRQSAQAAHERVIALLRRLDSLTPAQRILRAMHRWAFDPAPVCAGGVNLPYPLILAAGFVKGDGFADEASALQAVTQGHNIIPGWRSMPALVGPVEFGSFTRWPRLGNPGVVLWRDVPTQSTQNRIGLRNPGARAAAEFLAARREQLPAVFGVNIAISPGVDDPAQQQQEVRQSLDFFLNAGLIPAWFTLNLSCPNTEDDPGGHQTEALTRTLCRAVIDHLQGRAPLWVKVSPALADEQYAALMRVFAETGVQAVIATNTLGQPAPGADHLLAGMGGGQLHKYAVAATIQLTQARDQHDCPVDVIGCGGVSSRAAYEDFQRAGALAAQYWSALIYHGPLAAALILHEVAHA
jgi:dihydroorotate dehydrogenase